jgi:hypothetical protein
VSGLLEQRFRRVLRVLPAEYRREWEEDMVTAFLDGAHADAPDDPESVDLGRPTWSEVAGVLVLAARLRLGADVGAPPTALARGQAVRQVALLGLLANAVLTLVSAVPIVALPLADGAATADPPGAWWRLWPLAALLWVPAYLSLAAGRWRASRLLGVVALASAAGWAVTDLVLDGGVLPASRLAVLLLTAVPVAAMIAFHPAAPPVRPGPWYVALPVATAATVVLLALDRATATHEPVLDLAGLLSLALVTTTAGALLVGRRLRRPASASWLLTVALCGTVVLGLRLVTLGELLSRPVPAQIHPLLAVALVLSLVDLAVTGAAWMLARAALRPSLPHP